MISVYFAERHKNMFELLYTNRSLGDNCERYSEYHSDWMCDLCYSHPYDMKLFDYKTIISTPSRYRRVCSTCINNKYFCDIFSENVDEILSIIDKRLSK